MGVNINFAAFMHIALEYCTCWKKSVIHKLHWRSFYFLSPIHKERTWRLSLSRLTGEKSKCSKGPCCKLWPNFHNYYRWKSEQLKPQAKYYYILCLFVSHIYPWKPRSKPEEVKSIPILISVTWDLSRNVSGEWIGIKKIHMYFYF